MSENENELKLLEDLLDENLSSSKRKIALKEVISNMRNVNKRIADLVKDMEEKVKQAENP